MSRQARRIAKDLTQFMSAHLAEIVVGYAEHFATMSCCSNSQMERLYNEPLQSSFGGFAVRMSDGTVRSWGNEWAANSVPLKEGLKDVKAICGTWGDSKGTCFAAIVGNEGRVVTWGKMGNDLDDFYAYSVSELRRVVGICASRHAFAALKRDGTVFVWGNVEYGGLCSPEQQSELKGVRAIYSCSHAFAAVRHDGSVVVWGNPRYGGEIPLPVQTRLKKRRVQYMSGNHGAFAALLDDGTVETWGYKKYGGSGTPWYSSSLTNIVAVCPFSLGFVAVKEDGDLITWGDVAFAGDIRVKEVPGGIGITTNQTALATLDRNGRVVPGGVSSAGGRFPDGVAKELERGVVAVRATHGAFAALREDGTVVTWGKRDQGGDSSAVQSELKDVMSISASSSAFAARRRDGTVVTWGDAKFGGDSSSVPELLVPGAV